jgi:hypothetical protein
MADEVGTEVAAPSAGEPESEQPVGLPRGVPYARVWTAQAEPVLPADLADALTGRGFVPGFTDPEGTSAPMSETGLADARLELGAPGFRVVSLSSSKGNGCRISVHTADAAGIPDDLMARRTVSKPRLVYLLTAGGPSNSDRNLCENLAEALLLLTDGLVQIGGRGPRSGNRPVLYNRIWLGSAR